VGWSAEERKAGLFLGKEKEMGGEREKERPLVILKLQHTILK